MASTAEEPALKIKSAEKKVIKRKYAGEKEESAAKKSKVNTDPLENLIFFLEQSSKISEADIQKKLISRLEKNPQLITARLKRVSNPGSKPDILFDINLLHWAVYRGYANVVVYLLQLPQHAKLLDGRDSYERTPLCVAIIMANLTIFKRLLPYYTLEQLSRKDILSPLHVAAGGEGFVHTTMVEMILKRGVAIDLLVPCNVLSSRKNHTPLSYAASSGNIHTIKYLIERGADVGNNKGEDWLPSSNPFLILCSNTKLSPPQRAEIAELMLKKKPDLIESTDGWGRNALHKAAGSGNLDMIQFLYERGVKFPGEALRASPLQEAITGGHFEVVQSLIEKYPDAIDYTQNVFPNCLLFTVSQKYFETDSNGRPTEQGGYLKIVKLFFEKDSRFLNRCDDKGNTALHLALGRSPIDTELVQWLLDTMSVELIEKPNNDGQNALVYGLITSNSNSGTQKDNFSTDILNLLYKKVPQLFSVVNKEHTTILHLMARGQNRISMISWWCEHFKSNFRSFCNQLDTENHTPLYYILTKPPYEKELINLFLENLTNPINDPSLLYAACAIEDPDEALRVVTILMDYGAQKFINDIPQVGYPRGVSATPLYSAMRCGHLHIIRLLLSKGADMSQQNSPDDLPLAGILGNQKNKQDILDFFKNFYKEHPGKFNEEKKKVIADVLFSLARQSIHSGARGQHQHPSYYLGLIAELFDQDKSIYLDIINEQDVRPFLHELIKESDPAAETLLNLGASPCLRNFEGETPLHAAIIARNDIIARRLLQSPIVEHDAKDSFSGRTPLHFAVATDNVTMVELLIQRGASIAATDKGGETSLHLAVRRKNVEMVKLLLQHNAPMEIKNNKWHTPLDIAIGYNSVEIKKILYEHNAIKNPEASLIPAIREGNQDEVKRVLATGTKLHPLSLHLAAQMGHTNVVELLLNPPHNFDVNTLDISSGRGTALHLAAQRGHRDVAVLLLARGAKVDVVDKERKTPLHSAAAGGHKEVIRLLLAGGATADMGDNLGATPLHSAAASGQEEAIELLLQSGVDVNSRDKQGQTPLHCAISRVKTKNFKKVINILLRSGAEVNSLDSKGKTPLYSMLTSSDISSVGEDHMENMTEIAINLIRTHGAKLYFPDNPLLHAILDLSEFPFHLSTNLIKLLCEIDPRIIHQADAQDRLPLHKAVKKYLALEIIRVFSQSTDTILANAQDVNGQTALHIAVLGKQLPLLRRVKFLVEECGADFQLADNDGNTASDLAPPNSDIEKYFRVESVANLASRLSLQCGRSSGPVPMVIVDEGGEGTAPVVSRNPYLFAAPPQQTAELPEQGARKETGVKFEK